MYVLSRLLVNLTSPNRKSLKNTIDNIIEGCNKYNYEYCFDESKLQVAKFHRIPRHRWSITYLKSPFKHRKAIRHYVFERYSHNLTFNDLNQTQISPTVSIVLASLSPLVTAKCFFSWENSNNDGKNTGIIIIIIGMLLRASGTGLRILNNQLSFHQLYVEKSGFSHFYYRVFSKFYSSGIVLSEVQKDLMRNLEDIENRMSESKNTIVNGIYIHGGVGQGKTMLMDMFYNKSTQSKMRVHFHKFMSEIQKKLHKMRISGVDNALDKICEEIRESSRLICLDEFQVEHISDAMILKALFDKLFSLGCTLVSTSNKKPEELYLGGLNRERFLPFIDTLNQYCLVYNIDEKVDYRQSEGGITHFYWPCKGFDYIKDLITKMGIEPIARDYSLVISPLKTFTIPFVINSKDSNDKRLAAFTFNSLFNVPSGTNEYIKICDNFNVIGISDIPQFDITSTQSDDLTRFIKFIDIAYESNIKVIFDSCKPLYQMFGRLFNNMLFEELGMKLIELGIDPRDGMTEESFLAKFNTKLDDKSLKRVVDIIRSFDNYTFSDCLWSLVYENAIYYSEDEEFVKNITSYDYLLNNSKSQISFKFDDGLKNYPRTLSRIRHMISKNYWNV